MAHTGDGNKGARGGPTFSDLVTPNATFPNPGARNTSDHNWVRRNQEWLERRKRRSRSSPGETDANAKRSQRLPIREGQERRRAGIEPWDERGFRTGKQCSGSSPVPAYQYPNNFNYGHDSDNRRFSSDKPRDPRELLEQTRAGVDAHASMNESYGLCQPVATLGSHPWLRDSLTNTSEKEAGNAEPFPCGKLPKRGWTMPTMKRLLKIVLAVTAAPVALLAQTHGNFGNVNGIRFADQFPGADIGAKINAAAATCISGKQCRIMIPETGQLNFTTPINYVDNETIECTATGILDNTAGNNSLTQLSYTGSGTAIIMNAKSSRFKGCGLLLSSTTNTGILMAAYGGRIEDSDIRGGGSSTKMVNASGSVLTTNVDDVEIVNTRINAYTGTAVACDNVNDLRIFNVSAVGITSNATSIMLLVDTNCTGVTVSDYVGYNVGLHGLFMRKTLSGPPPQSFFFRNFECDLPTSDCFLFDSTLVSLPLHFACDNCWAAGASGAGIHISGGSEVAFSHAQIRANGNDGVLIDGNLVEEVSISNSLIGGNNIANAGFNGISIRNHPAQIVIVGNEIGDSTEVGGFQQYALNAYSDVEGLVFSSNDCALNVVGCANVAAVTTSKLTYFGNMNVVSGASNEPSYFMGSVTSGTSVYKGQASINVVATSTPTALPNTTGLFGVLSVRDQTLGGVAVFVLDPNNGAQLLGASNITGLASAAGVTYSGGWRISLSSGATPRALLWTLFQ